MTLYETLGVAKDASGETIKKAWRSLAQQYHPDKEGGDAEKFRAVQLAYEVLSDSERRAKYDQTGQTGQKPNAHSVAMESLGKLLNECVDAYEVEFTDLFSVAHDKIMETMRTADLNIQDINARIKKRQNVLKRMKFKGQGDNIAAMMLEHSITDLNKTLEGVNNGKNVLTAMLGMLKEYEYTTDPDTRNPLYGQGLHNVDDALLAMLRSSTPFSPRGKKR